MPKLLSRSRLSAGAVVGGQLGADCGVVERHGGEEDAGAVQVEVAAVDPELAEPESQVAERYRAPGPVASSNERLREYMFARRVQVPEPFRLAAPP